MAVLPAAWHGWLHHTYIHYRSVVRGWLSLVSRKVLTYSPQAKAQIIIIHYMLSADRSGFPGHICYSLFAGHEVFETEQAQ